MFGRLGSRSIDGLYCHLSPHKKKKTVVMENSQDRFPNYTRIYWLIRALHSLLSVISVNKKKNRDLSILETPTRKRPHRTC